VSRQSPWETTLRRVQPKKVLTVSVCGAPAGARLQGGGVSNQGLLIKVFQEQVKGKDGGIKGRFLILDAGNNKHSPVLCGLLQRLTDAEEVLGLIRRKDPGCVSVVNANSLVANED
jgi:hypothetical protein